MIESISAQDYVVEYIRANLELLDDEDKAITRWLAEMYFYIEAWQFGKAQSLIRAVKSLDLSSFARGLFYLGVGDLHRQQQAWSAALEAYWRALDHFRHLDSRQDEAMVLNNLAIAYQEKQDYEKAIESYEQAAAIYEALGDTQSLGQVFANLGSVADAQTDWQQAVSYYQQSIQCLEQAEAQEDLPTVLNNLGVAFECLGNLSQAEQHYTRCVDLLDELGHSYSSAGVRILNNLGQLYAKRAAWDKAVNCYKWALEICQEIEDLYGEGTTWNNLGTVYTAQADYTQAAECYRRSAERHNRLGNRQGKALALSNLGAAYEDLGELALAETCFRNSLTLSEELGDPYGVARSDNNLGVLYENQERYDEAIAHYRRCVDDLRALGDGHREVTTLINICTLYETLLQSDEAVPYFNRAWEVSEARGYVDHLVSLCMLRGDAALQYLERFAEAGDWFARACEYVLHLNSSDLEKIVRHINIHLERFQSRAQDEQLKIFCEKLLKVWMKEAPLQQQQPELFQTLQELA